MIRAALLASLLLTGCVADKVSFDRGAFTLGYADLKAAVAVKVYQVRTACNAGKIPAEACRDVEAQVTELVRMEAQIRKVIANPDLSPDWDRILEYAGIILSLAGKAI